MSIGESVKHLEPTEELFIEGPVMSFVIHNTININVDDGTWPTVYLDVRRVTDAEIRLRPLLMSISVQSPRRDDSVDAARNIAGMMHDNNLAVAGNNELKTRHVPRGYPPITRSFPPAPTPPGPSRDAVNHPAHYQGKNGLEAIDVIENFELNFRVGNAVKYLLRAGRKHPNIKQDLEKARWYLDREIEKLS